jgi:membrane protein
MGLARFFAVRRRIQTSREVARDTVSNWLRHRSAVESAALAFYTMFSLAPMLLVVIAVAGAIWGEDAVRGQIVREFEGLMGRDAARTVQEVLRSAVRLPSGPVATAIGIVTLLSGATAFFVQLQDSLNHAWEVAPRPGHLVSSFLWKRLISFGMVVGIGFLLLVSLAVSAALSSLEAYVERYMAASPVAFLQAVNQVLSFGVIALLFALIYRVLPDAKIAWRDVALGAVVTALMFTVGKYLIGLYLGRTRIASAYGAAGSVVVILIWVYYSTLVLLLGAEFTRVYSRRFRPTRVQPEPGAMRVAPPAEVPAASASGGRGAR